MTNRTRNQADLPVALDPELARVKQIGDWLDKKYVDPIIGLIPGVGDGLSALIGSYVIWVAAKRGVSRLVIGRMLANLLLDTIFGFIPIAGDLADFAFQANTRNIKLLLDRETKHAGRSTRTDWMLVAGVVLAIVASLGLCVWGFIRLLQWLL